MRIRKKPKQKTPEAEPLREYQHGDLALVQDLSLHTDPKIEGFDGFFRLGYMGAAEYEWGAAPASLRAMREDLRDLGISHFYVEDRQVFVVGSSQRRLHFMAILPGWLAAGHPGKYVYSFPRALRAKPGDETEFGRRPDAWWALREHVMFTFSAETAAVLMRGVMAVPSSKRKK